MQALAVPVPRSGCIPRTPSQANETPAFVGLSFEVSKHRHQPEIADGMADAVATCSVYQIGERRPRGHRSAVPVNYGVAHRATITGLAGAIMQCQRNPQPHLKSPLLMAETPHRSRATRG